MKNKKFSYNYFVKVISEDNEIAYRAYIPKFPKLLIMSDNPIELHSLTEEIIEEEIKRLKKTGKKIPTPDFETKFSGKILIRTSPELHEKLITEAKVSNISVNKLILEKLMS